MPNNCERCDGAVCAFSVRRHEFFEEAYVVFREKTEVLNLIFEIGNAFNTHAEGIAFVYVGVDAVGFEYVGIDHSAPEDFHPSRVFAECAALTAADVARNVHLCRRFGEGEI